MKTSRVVMLAVLLCALVPSGAVLAEDDTAATAALQDERCCFENPRFSGTCEVTPGPDESCGDILAYLNNPNSVGKNYCGNTKVRGGWTLVACKDAASARSSCTVASPQE